MALCPIGRIRGAADQEVGAGVGPLTMTLSDPLVFPVPATLGSASLQVLVFKGENTSTSGHSNSSIEL